VLTVSIAKSVFHPLLHRKICVTPAKAGVPLFAGEVLAAKRDASLRWHDGINEIQWYDQIVVSQHESF
jgi:hypothetical protein